MDKSWPALESDYDDLVRDLGNSAPRQHSGHPLHRASLLRCHPRPHLVGGDQRRQAAHPDQRPQFHDAGTGARSEARTGSFVYYAAFRRPLPALAARRHCPVPRTQKPRRRWAPALSALQSAAEHSAQCSGRKLFSNFPARRPIVAYAESLAAVSYINDSYGMSDIQRILERLSQGNSTEAALRATIHSDYGQLESDLAQAISPTNTASSEGHQSIALRVHYLPACHSCASFA